jgi:uncharacterized membrane protein
MAAVRFLSVYTLFISILLTLAGVTQAADTPLLHYTFDGRYDAIDHGQGVPADGIFTNDATRGYATPADVSCGTLDLTGDNAVHNYISTDGDIEKIDALSVMTLTFWLNLQNDPSRFDALFSDVDRYDPEGYGGWKLLIAGPAGSDNPTADNFGLQFHRCESRGSYALCQFATSDVIDADHKWVFIALVVADSQVRHFYGSEHAAVSQWGPTLIGFDVPFLQNSSEFRIGSDTYSPDDDHTPPAWIDDVRIYGEKLTVAEMEQIRLENIQKGQLGNEPGFVVLDKPAGGQCNNWAYAMTPDASVVVGMGYDGSHFRAARWDNGAMSFLERQPDARFAVGYGVSADGSIVVGQSSVDQTREAVLWDDGVLNVLGNLPGGSHNNAAAAVSDDGTVMAGWSSAGSAADDLVAVTWPVGVITPLAPLSPEMPRSMAFGISGDGSTIVGAALNPDNSGEAVAWRNGVPEPLGDLPGGASDSIAYAATPDGLIIVGTGSSEAGREACYWSNGEVVGLGFLSASEPNSQAYAISADGRVILGVSGDHPDVHVFIWDPIHGMRDLQDLLLTELGIEEVQGWTLGLRDISPTLSISNDGTLIAGTGVDPERRTRAWMARIPLLPRPADLDNDGDVDRDDSTLFEQCATGPDIPYTSQSPPLECTLSINSEDILPVDFDADFDVDQDDFAVFQRCFSGEGNIADPRCAE